MSIPAGLPPFGGIRTIFSLYSSTMFTDTSFATPAVTQGVQPANYWRFPNLDPNQGLEVWGKARGVALIGIGVGADNAGFKAKVFAWSRLRRTDNLDEYTPLADFCTFDFTLGGTTNSRILPGTTLRAADVVELVTAIPGGLESMPAANTAAYNPGGDGIGVAAVVGIPEFIDGLTFAFDINSHATAPAVTSANFLVAPIFGESLNGP